MRVRHAIAALFAAPLLALAVLPRVGDRDARLASAATLNRSGSASAAALNRSGSASAAYDRFKSLAGEWDGKSTKGWTERATFRVIAGGSVVTETSFDAHPNETMLTAYHLDRDRLLLTHYCVARNQPRLVATSFGEDGRTVTFTFLDATGLSSRDQGHMDQAVYRFVDDDNFTTQWTWYQDGKERWMEEITMTRVKPSP